MTLVITELRTLFVVPTFNIFFGRALDNADTINFSCNTTAYNGILVIVLTKATLAFLEFRA